MNPIIVFLDLLRQALTYVDNYYYGLHWSHESIIEAHMGHAQSLERNALEKFLDRYDERVFCYELYYQIRTLMDEFSRDYPDKFQGIMLQSELRKDYLEQVVADIMHAQPLDREYFPDFLLHTPGHFNNQLLIIEVKSSPKLSFSGMTNDLLKIQQFINRYQYKRGVFLTINTDPDRITNALSQVKTIEWLRNNINTPDRIHFLCKMNRNVDLYERTIDQLLL